MTSTKVNDILGSAYILPATAGGLLLFNDTHPAIVWGLLVISVISFIFLLGSICRFIINSLRKE